MVTDMTTIVIANKYEVAYGISIDIFGFNIDPVYIARSRSLHISTANISKMVIGKLNITIAMKYEVVFGLLISIFTFCL